MTRPRRTEYVTLRLPASGDALPARVEDADGELLTLVLTSPTSSAGDERAGVVEYTTPRGVHRLSISLVDRPGAEPGVVHALPHVPEQIEQRRDFVRVDAFLQVRVRVTGAVDGAARTTTLDISGGGMLLQDPLGLPLGAELELELELEAGDVPVRAHGRVVREVEPDVKAVLIETIAAADRQRLIHFVTARERLALRIARGR